jgi:hypothetical protein
MRTFRVVAALTTAAVIVLAGALPAAAGSDLELEGRKKNGSFSQDGVAFNLVEGKRKDVFLRVAAEADLDLLLEEEFASEDGGYKSRYFRGSNDITTKVKVDGKGFHLDAGEKARFRASFKLVNDDIGTAACYGLVVNAVNVMEDADLLVFINNPIC